LALSLRSHGHGGEIPWSLTGVEIFLVDGPVSEGTALR
jgi:hypothetical protein